MIRQLMVAGVIVFSGMFAFSCHAKDSKISGSWGVKALVYPQQIQTGTTMEAAAGWRMSAAIPMSLTKSQEDRLIDGINKLIGLADGIRSSSGSYDIKEIEFNVGMDANADVYLITAGSSEGIKVTLTKRGGR